MRRQDPLRKQVKLREHLERMYEGDNNWVLSVDSEGFIGERTGDIFFIVENSVIIAPEGIY